MTVVDAESHRLWSRPALAIVAAVNVLLLLTPAASGWRLAFARVIGVLACGYFWSRLQRMPSAMRRVWFWFGLYLAFTVVGDVWYDVETSLRGAAAFPGTADAFYLPTYLFAIFGLVRLMRLLSPERDTEAWLDTAIITISAASVVVAFVIAPLVRGSGDIGPTTVVSVAYPLLDVVLLAALARALVMPRLRNRALFVLALSMLAFLTYDLAFNALAVHGDFTEYWWMEPLWTTGILLLPLAVTTDGAEQFSAVPNSAVDRVTPLRGLAMSIAVLVPALLLRYAMWTDNPSMARWLGPGGFIVLVLVLLRMYRLLRIVQQQSVQLEEIARTDGLTGLPNRRTWDYEIARAAQRSAAEGSALTIALLDLDHFKLYNDAHGHVAGDQFLRVTVRAWRDILASGAVLARYGGEEFGLLMPGVSVWEAAGLLERLRVAVPFGGSVSIGATQLLDGEDVTQAVRRADFAMYRAKERGRNCVVIDDALEP